MGADVASTGKKEIGFAPIQLTASGRESVLAPLEGVPVLHWHGDQFEIPTDGVRLAETLGFPNQAFLVGDSILGVQFHPEVDSSRIESWLIGHAHELGSAGINPNSIRSDSRIYGPDLEAAGQQVFDSWLQRLESL